MDQNFIFRKSEFGSVSGHAREDFYINRQSVPGSDALLHLQLWLDSVWEGYKGLNTVSESMAFAGLVLSGRQFRQTGDGEQILQRGDLILERRKNETLQMKTLQGEPLHRIGVLISRTTAFEALACALFPERTTVVHCHDPERMKTFFLAIKTEIIEQGGRPEVISRMLFSLFQEIVRQRKNADQPEPLRKALDFIHTHGFRQISRDELSACAGVSVRTLNDLFRNCCHTTPGNYMRQRRIAYAEELLSSHRLTVADTAGLAGFSSVEYFIREFRRHTGKTPGKYG